MPRQKASWPSLSSPCFKRPVEQTVPLSTRPALSNFHQEKQPPPVTGTHDTKENAPRTRRCSTTSPGARLVTDGTRASPAPQDRSIDPERAKLPLAFNGLDTSVWVVSCMCARGKRLDSTTVPHPRFSNFIRKAFPGVDTFDMKEINPLSLMSCLQDDQELPPPSHIGRSGYRGTLRFYSVENLDVPTFRSCRTAGIAKGSPVLHGRLR